MIKVYILASAILLICSCAPKYKIVHDYTPPTSTYGLSCLNKQCHKQNLYCQNLCLEQYTHCQQLQEQNAIDDFNQILGEYYAKLELHQSKLDLYFQKQKIYLQDKKFLKRKQKHALEQCESKQLNKHNCPNYKKFKKKLKKLNKPYKPHKPFKPTLRQTIVDYQKFCHNDCQCKENFNQCYVGCGGQVNSRKICIDNCD
jgi:hypothetical protein